MRTFDNFACLAVRSARFGAGLILLLLVTGCHCTNGWIMNNSGMGYYQKGNYSMARKEFQRAVIDRPKDPDHRHNLAMAMQKQGDAAGAETVLRHNLSVDPMHQPTYHALTQILISQQRTAEADQLLAGWRESQPYVPEAYIEQAWFQHETGNRVAAEQTLQQALQIKPNHPVALAQLGQLYHESGQTNQAATYYQRSLLSRWNQPEVRSRLASITSGTTTSAPASRSAMVLNDVQTVSLNSAPTMGQATYVQTAYGAQPVSQPVMTMGTAPMTEAVAMEDPVSRQRRHHHHRHNHRNGANQQLTAYPLPNFDMADAGGYQSGMVSAVPTTFGPTIGSSPFPEISTATQPSFGPPVVATSPTLIPQADPSHATEMTAGLPVVDPH